MRYRLSLFAVLLAVSASAQAAPPKVCTLVTPAQVQSVIGGNVGAGQEEPNPGPEPRCNFGNHQSKSFYVSYAAVADLGPAGAMIAKHQMLCSPEPGKTCEKLQGVGEGANYTTSNGDALVIFLYHGYLCTVRAMTDRNGMTLPGVRDPLIALAKAVVAKM